MHYGVRLDMKTKILNYSEWWEMESGLNKLIPGEEDLPDFDDEQTSAERALIDILSLRGKQDEDWEVPEHYSRCAVLYTYVLDESILEGDLLSDIARVIPKSKYSWYAQLECSTSEGESLGDILIYDDTCYFNAEDKVVETLSDFLNISLIRAKYAKFYSKFKCRKQHAALLKQITLED